MPAGSAEMLWAGPSLLRGYRALGLPSTWQPFEFYRLLNCRLDRGILEKRGGYDTLQTGGVMAGGGAVNSLYCTAGTTNKVVMAAVNTRLYSIPKAGGAATERAAGLPSAVRWDMCEFVSGGVTYWIGANGSGVPHRWNTTDASTTAMAGQTIDAGVFCDVLMANNGRLWMGKGRTVYVAQLRQLDTYSGSTLIIDSDGRQGNLTRLVPLERAQSLWFCEREVYLMLGTDPGDQTGMPNIRILDLFEVGAPSNRAVVRVGGEVYFFGVENGRYGFFTTDGSEVRCISDNLQDDLDTVNTAVLETAVAVQVGKNVVFGLALGAATEVSKLFVYHRTLPGRPWSTWSFAANPRCFARDPATGTVFWGNQTTANVQRYLPTTYNDLTAAIDMDVITGPWSVGMDLIEFTDFEAHFSMIASGSVALSVGRDEDAEGSFVAFPTSPFSTAATGAFGDDSGGESYTWQGVARAFKHFASADNHAQAWRVRLRSNNVYDCKLLRARSRGSVIAKK